ncbi:MAG: DUF1924 domain-containing protein [Alphaproteobacteria bacterium]
MRTFFGVAVLALIVVAAAPRTAAADPARDAILVDLAAKAKAADAGFSGFSAARGETLFRTKFGTGKPETPACTTCHTDSPRAPGQTRAGKPIDPMAVSRTPNRFTDPRKVAKWFRRNCKSVLGRECTAQEKGDYITFMMSQ